MKKILFLDLASHRNSLSGTWMLELLKSRYEVDLRYATSRNSKDIPLRQEVQQYDAIIFWQIAPIVSRAASYKMPTIYAPMYDSETYNRGKWMRIKFHHASVISFTDREASFIRPLGLPILDAKYFSPHKEFCPGDPRKLFLWDRGDIHFADIKKLFAPGFLTEMVVRCNETEADKISAEDRRLYGVRIVPHEQYLSRDAYLNIFSDCGIFVAPRLKEGIGLSFIEAMMCGKCVVAHDDATMNEYLDHMRTGILVDFKKKIHRLDISVDDIKKMQCSCYEEAERGLAAWRSSRQKILDFIEDSIINYRDMSIWERFLWLILFPYHILGDARTYLRTYFWHRFFA